nr:MAG TPA: UBA-like domain protein [Caudoviricetes sp.]
MSGFDYEDAAKIKQCDRWDLERMYNKDETI